MSTPKAIKSTAAALAAVLIALAISPFFAACAKKGYRIERGEWNGDTYTNRAVGIRLKAPEELLLASDEEINKFTNIGQELLSEKQQKAAQRDDELSRFRTVYDFVLHPPAADTDEDVYGHLFPTYSLYYENIALDPSLRGMTLVEYISHTDTVLRSLEKPHYIVLSEGKPYEFTVADKTWYRIDYSVDGFYMMQDFFYRRLENGLIVCLVISYNGSTAKSAEAFIESIEALRQ